eukprot:TRINITY_DN12569_c0_g1_i18.p1 TRINITY_DN12569_c0_g1~~TRINITY_DN12569_c0_g1_i18.p1  ORF type:complete len:337 (+),score=82.50 TRINITY_DN12569_c0_g1_i18:98-1012(+)
MAEHELGFDPTKKKKKKKKKVLVAMEDEVAAANTAPSQEAAPEPSSVTAETPTETDIVAPPPNKLDEPLDDSFLNELLAGDIDFSKLHKRKRKVVDSGAAGSDLDFSKKKKKKKKKAGDKPLAELDASGEVAANTDDQEGQVYEYSRLLTRVFGLMSNNNPDIVSGETKKFTMKPPQVVRLGAKKTGFVNFTDICKLLHRQPDHLLAFLFSELGTSGSVDSSNCLVIKGRFQQKQIESILRRYIREYVTCHTCRSPNTLLAKYSRLYFLQCESCGARCSVASINSGFQAVTGRRAALRAKAAAK